MTVTDGAPQPTTTAVGAVSAKPTAEEDAPLSATAEEGAPPASTVKVGDPSPTQSLDSINIAAEDSREAAGHNGVQPGRTSEEPLADLMP
uniref:Uncharacterized protein n=1 Tax=Kalanchoe fedtschenkoi TaxID=63787 RepID=A0A7N0RBW8_KALFE